MAKRLKGMICLAVSLLAVCPKVFGKSFASKIKEVDVESALNCSNDTTGGGGGSGCVCGPK